MANSILKLSVEDKEYNSKLKSAAEGIQHLIKRAHDLQGDFANLDKAELEFIRDLGYMNTSARTASGNVRELETAYRGLATAYNQLSDFEKNDEGGRALAASLDMLKQRAQDARAAMNEATKSLNDNGTSSKESSGMLDQLAQKFTINVDALKLFEYGLKAANVALDVAKDAFFASEANVDEWGRTIAASQSVYESFLTSINNGDISGFLSNIDSIVNAARLAYDELDKLGTMKTIQAPQISQQQTENDRIRTMIQTGRYIAPQDGRRAAMVDGREMKTGDRLTAAQIRALEKSLQGGMQKMVTLVGNEVEQTGKAIDAYYDTLAKTNGMSLQEFKKGTSSWDEFSKRIKGYDDYKRFESEHTSTIEQWNPHTMQYETKFTRDEARNPYQQYANWGTFRVDKEGDNSLKDLVNLIKQRDQQIDQMYNTQGQAYRAINRAEGFTVRQVLGGGGGGTTPRATTKVKLTEEEKAQKTAEKELEAATKRLTEARQQLVEAQGSGNLKDIYAAEKKVATAELGVQKLGGVITNDVASVTTPVNLTLANLDAFKGKLKEDLSNADLGSSVAQSLQESMNDTSAISAIMQTAIKNGIDTAQFDTNGLMSKLLNGQDISDADIQTYVDQLNAQLKAKFDEVEWPKVLIKFDADAKTITNISNNQKKDAEELADDWREAGAAISAVGTAMSLIEDPAAKVMSTIAQAIATIALTFAKSLEKTFGPWDWIAAAAAGTATMISTIAAIKSATAGSFAEGGIIPGNSMSGDNLRLPVVGGGMIAVNSGETILNRAQQGNLLAQMEGGGLQNLHLSTEISGENLRIVLQNNNERHGYGEVFTFNM